ncbi:hypothetical protein BH24BAC1_BH24BAC1_16010 [soil metagenome]|jgi:hypothetical protein
MIHLAVGQEVIKNIPSRDPLFSTGVNLKKEETYNLRAFEDDHWVDFFIKCKADGVDVAWFTSRQQKLRVPTAKRFALIGAIEGEPDFLIGLKKDGFSPSVGGELMCYANDEPGWYWNNWGSIRLKIIRIK